MADLAELDRSEAVKIAGAAPSTGVTDNYVQVDSNGNMFTNLRTGAVEQIAQKTMVNSIPTVIASDQSAVPTAATTRTTQPSAYTNGTQNPITIDEYGNKVHSGRSYTMGSWGKAFSVTTGITILTGALEIPFLLIRNPNASGKTCKLRRLSTTQGATFGARYNVYMNPTVTTNGSVLMPVGGRQTGQTASVVLCNLSPTVSNYGTLFLSLEPANAYYPVLFDFNRWLEANNSMLVTVLRVTTAQSDSQSVSIEYSEE